MTYDRREKVAGGKTIADYLRTAEISFFEAVGKLLHKGVRVEVVRGVSLPMLTFEGYDLSDLAYDGYAALVIRDSDVLLHMEMKHAMLGIKKDELRTKIGVLTPELAAKRINEFIGLSR